MSTILYRLVFLLLVGSRTCAKESRKLIAANVLWLDIERIAFTQTRVWILGTIDSSRWGLPRLFRQSHQQPTIIAEAVIDTDDEISTTLKARSLFVSIEILGIVVEILGTWQVVLLYKERAMETESLFGKYILDIFYDRGWVGLLMKMTEKKKKNKASWKSNSVISLVFSWLSRSALVQDWATISDTNYIHRRSGACPHLRLAILCSATAFDVFNAVHYLFWAPFHSAQIQEKTDLQATHSFASACDGIHVVWSISNDNELCLTQQPAGRHRYVWASFFFLKKKESGQLNRSISNSRLDFSLQKKVHSPWRCVYIYIYHEESLLSPRLPTRSTSTPWAWDQASKALPALSQSEP